MEPRPHERGNRRSCAGVCVWWSASMEPRPHERGNHVSGPLDASGLQASMEPRPHERGNRLPVLWVRRVGRRFNGATSSRTWKLIRVTLKRDAPTTLQWSHVLTNVETDFEAARNVDFINRFN